MAQAVPDNSAELRDIEEELEQVRAQIQQLWQREGELTRRKLALEEDTVLPLQPVAFQVMSSMPSGEPRQSLVLELLRRGKGLVERQKNSISPTYVALAKVAR